MRSNRNEARIIRLQPREVAAVSSQLIEVQRRAYSIEAALIGDDRIPHLSESAEMLIAADLTWHVALMNSAIAAAIAYSDSGSSLVVDRVFVEPSWHRRGLARRLMLSLGPNPVSVSTGRDNRPARKLYESLGFSHIGDTKALPGLWLSRYSRRRQPPALWRDRPLAPTRS